MAERSRRWVLQVGAGVLLGGFSGAEAESAEPLPPGLYLPSLDHLAHALHEASRAPLAGHTPQFFTPDEFALLRRVLANLLGDIPNEPTVISEIANWIDLTVHDSAAVRAAALEMAPMHRILAIHYHGAEAARNLEMFDPQQVCREGLRTLAGKSDLKIAPGPFFDYIRTAALEGYYTSKEGLHELDYKGNSFYSESPGCNGAFSSASSATSSIVRT